MLSENNEIRSNVLERLKISMDQAGVANRLLKKGEENSPFDVLVCTHTGVNGALDGKVTGQYFFPEMESAENVCYFTCMMTVKEDISEEEASAVYEKIKEVNLTLVCGLFAVYPGIGLVYKLTVPVAEVLSEMELFECIDIYAAHAIALTATFVPEIL